MRECHFESDSQRAVSLHHHIARSVRPPMAGNLPPSWFPTWRSISAEGLGSICTPAWSSNQTFRLPSGRPSAAEAHLAHAGALARRLSAFAAAPQLSRFLACKIAQAGGVISLSPSNVLFCRGRDSTKFCSYGRSSWLPCHSPGGGGYLT